MKLRDQPDGYEFSIKTPVTPPRWQDYHEVRDALLALESVQLFLELVANLHRPIMARSDELMHSRPE